MTEFGKAGLLLILIILIGLPTALMADEQAGIVVPETHFAFGLVPYGSIVTHTFWIKNVGDTTVHVGRIRAGCACTTVPMKQKVIAPGDSIPATIVLNTEKIPRRPFRKRPRIGLTDPNMSEVVFLITGVLYDPLYATLPLKMEPYLANFALDEGDTTAEIAVTNMTKKDYRIWFVSVPPESRYEIELPNRQLMPGYASQIKLRLKPEYRNYTFENSFTVDLTDDQRTRFTIPVVVTQRPVK